MSNSIILGIDLGGIIICCIFLNDALRENRPLKTIVIYTLFTFFNSIMFANSVCKFIQSII